MSEIKFVCTHCPRPTGDYEDYKHLLGQMTEQEYLCPKCNVCRSCGYDPAIDVDEIGDLYLGGGSN